MAFKLFDWIKDTTTSAGTDDFELAGAFATFRSFGDVLADGDTVHYTAYIDGHRESGLGTYHSTTGVLARTTVYDSTDGGAKVSFPAGTKIIECSPIGSRLLTRETQKTHFLADKNGVNQNASNNEKITFTNEVIDLGSVYDAANSRVVPKSGEAMVLHVSATVPSSNTSDTKICLFKNGSLYRSFHIEASGAASDTVSGTVLASVVGNGSDYYEVYLQTQEGGYTVHGDPVRSWFEGWAI